MKISISTEGIIDKIGIDAGFKAIGEAGIEAVDFELCRPYTWEYISKELPVEFFTNKEMFWSYIEEAKVAAKKYGVEFGQLHAPFPTYNPKYPKTAEYMADAINMCIEATAYLGCKYLVIHPIMDGSFRYPAFTKEQEIEENLRYYTSIIPLLKKTGVICCLENMWGQDWGTKKIYEGTCTDPVEANYLIDTLNERAGEKIFGFCLDTGHLLLVGKDCYNVIKKLGDNLLRLHISDNDGINDLHTMPFTGVQDWNHLAKGLKLVGYNGTLNYEVGAIFDKVPKNTIPALCKMFKAIGDDLNNRINELQ